MGTVATWTESPLVGLLGRKQYIGCVHDPEDMPSGRAPVGLLPGGHQHLVRADRWVGQEALNRRV
jgi:hypothetical protein